MRILATLALTVLTVTAAMAQNSVYLAERGHWTVMNYPAACRAVNRPAADFNQSPFNALQITVRPKSAISIDVFFWPGALTADRDYQLQLRFSAGDMTLPARAAMGDFMLASVDDMGLWRKLQDSRTLSVGVVGEPHLSLSFTLDDIRWVLNALTTCSGFLPKT